MKIINPKTQCVIVSEVLKAHHFFSRMRGLLFRAELNQNQGLWLRPCNSVHTFAMRFAIDVLFLDRENRIIKVIPQMNPGRMSPLVAGARSVIELKKGTIERLGIETGDCLEFRKR